MAEPNRKLFLALCILASGHRPSWAMTEVNDFIKAEREDLAEEKRKFQARLMTVAEINEDEELSKLAQFDELEPPLIVEPPQSQGPVLVEPDSEPALSKSKTIAELKADQALQKEAAPDAS